MAAITAITTEYAAAGAGQQVVRYSGTSAANSADTLTTPAVAKHHSRKLLFVSVHYSASPTYTATALTVKIDSALGASYDLTLFAGSANNAQDVVYLPDPDIRQLPGDAIVVAAPAGGSGITAAIQVTVLEY